MTRLRDSRVLAVLASLKLAALLIALLALLSLLAVIIPQQLYLGAAYDQFAQDAPTLAAVVSALGLHRIYDGWPIVVLAALLVVNLIACTLRRVLRRSRPLRGDLAVDPAWLEALRILRDERWVPVSASGGHVVARAGGSGFWGSVVMHLGLIVIVLGAVATVLTSFRGEVLVSEGQTVVDDRGSYLSVGVEPRFGTPFSGTRVTLQDMRVEYRGDIVIDAVASMSALEPDGDTIAREVRVNHPLDAGGKSYLLQDSGYSVRMVIGYEDGTAEPLVVALGQEMPYGWVDRLEPTSPDGRPVSIDLLATPVPLAEWEDLPAEKHVIVDPRLRLRIDAGGSVWEGTLSRGQTADADGLTVTFEDLVLWNRYLVRGEPARWVTYAGFYIAIVGAVWRFLVPERRIAVSSSDGLPNVRLHARPWRGRHAQRDESLVERIIGSAEDGAAGPDGGSPR